MDKNTLIIIGLAGLAIFLYTQNQKAQTTAALLQYQASRPLVNTRGDAEVIGALGEGLSGVITSIGGLFN